MMESEVIKKICSNCEKGLAFKKVRCPFRSISNDYCEEIESIRKDLEKYKCIIKIIEQEYKELQEGQEQLLNDSNWDYEDKYRFNINQQKLVLIGKLRKVWLENE